VRGHRGGQRRARRRAAARSRAREEAKESTGSNPACQARPLPSPSNDPHTSLPAPSMSPSQWLTLSYNHNKNNNTQLLFVLILPLTLSSPLPHGSKLCIIATPPLVPRRAMPARVAAANLRLHILTRLHTSYVWSRTRPSNRSFILLPIAIFRVWWLLVVIVTIVFAVGRPILQPPALLLLLLLFPIFAVVLLVPSQIESVVLLFVLVCEPLGIVRELHDKLTPAATQFLHRLRTKSRPDMPVSLPAACCVSFAFRIACCSACFLSIRVLFHLANVSGVTGVRLDPSLCRSTSRNSSSEIVLAFAASSIAFFCDLSTKPGGSACRYLHFSPSGHSQNQPYLL